MERQNFIKKYGGAILLALFYSVGILGHSLENFLPLMKDLTPITLFLSVAFVIYLTRSDWNKKVIIWAVATFVLTFSLEVIGVSTGAVFGNYTYGDTLGPKLFGVPVIIGINWVMIIYAIVSALTKATANVAALVFLAATATVAFDFVMEPVAMHLGYWNWMNDKIPFQNYIAWFVIAAVSALGFFFLKQKPKHDLPIFLVLIQFLFFLMLEMILVR
ncbi:MAG: carotenoid biosynthesis protein [Ignavibacteria bacterium]|nr:carotenoid biosynthesis protein [Ignavibacteria bacterium]